MAKRSAVTVFVETGSKRVFAGAIDWPGWCRSAKSEDAALQTLAAYAPRYAPVAARAGQEFPAAFAFAVEERAAGTATTDFGAPDAKLPGDTRPLGKAELDRLIALMRAGWATFDDTVSRAPAALRKGPRGGGRDRDRIAEHVLGAEGAYAGKLGVRLAQPALGDGAAIEAFRDAVVSACRGAASARGGGAQPAWPVRYFIRRLTWHALDHAWEIEDRSRPE